MQLVDQPGEQILPHGRDAAPQPDVAAVGGDPRLFQSGMNAFGDEAKLGTSGHRDRRSRVVRQHEDGRVIRWLVAPPALPAVVRPRAANRTEHIAPEYPRTDSGKALLGNIVIDARFTISVALHPVPQACMEDPLHQFWTPDAERILEILVRPSTIAVDGNRKAMDAQFNHCFPPR